LNNYLSTSTNLFLEKISNNYFLFSFYSSTEFSVIKLNIYFENPECKYYIINNDLVRNNINYYYIPFIYASDLNNIYILLNSEVNNFNLLKYQAEESLINVIYNNTPIIPSDLLTFKIEKIINNIIFGNIYNITDEYYNITIYSTNKKPDERETYIDLLNCDSKLKQTNNFKDGMFFTSIGAKGKSKDEKADDIDINIDEELAQIEQKYKQINEENSLNEEEKIENNELRKMKDGNKEKL
jgi:hypothetical protein